MAGERGLPERLEGHEGHEGGRLGSSGGRPRREILTGLTRSRGERGEVTGSDASSSSSRFTTKSRRREAEAPRRQKGHEGHEGGGMLSALAQRRVRVCGARTVGARGGGVCHSPGSTSLERPQAGIRSKQLVGVTALGTEPRPLRHLIAEVLPDRIRRRSVCSCRGHANMMDVTQEVQAIELRVAWYLVGPDHRITEAIVEAAGRRRILQSSEGFDRGIQFRLHFLTIVHGGSTALGRRLSRPAATSGIAQRRTRHWAPHRANLRKSRAH